MPAQLSLSSTIKKLLVYSITVGTFTILPAPRAMAYTTWTITVDVHTGKEKPVYGFSYDVYPSCAGLPVASAQRVENLTICPGDIVQWKPITTGGNGLLTIHQKEGFRHGVNVPSQWFHGEEGGNPAILTTAVTDKAYSHEYCVAVYDDTGSPYNLYSHDPKIIIGGTNIEAEIEQFKVASRQLLAAIANDPDAKKEAREKAAKEAAKINDQIQEIVRLLKK